MAEPKQIFAGMKFRMHFGQERKELLPLVEKERGGVFTKATGGEVIILVDKESQHKQQNGVNSAFVSDSIKNNQIMDVHRYRVVDGKQPAPARKAMLRREYGLNDRNDVIRHTLVLCSQDDWTQFIMINHTEKVVKLRGLGARRIGVLMGRSPESIKTHYRTGNTYNYPQLIYKALSNFAKKNPTAGGVYPKVRQLIRGREEQDDDVEEAEEENDDETDPDTQMPNPAPSAKADVVNAVTESTQQETNDSKVRAKPGIIGRLANSLGFGSVLSSPVTKPPPVEENVDKQPASVTTTDAKERDNEEASTKEDGNDVQETKTDRMPHKSGGQVVKRMIDPESMFSPVKKANDEEDSATLTSATTASLEAHKVAHRSTVPIGSSNDDDDDDDDSESKKEDFDGAEDNDDTATDEARTSKQKKRPRDEPTEGPSSPKRARRRPPVNYKELEQQVHEAPKEMEEYTSEEDEQEDDGEMEATQMDAVPSESTVRETSQEDGDGNGLVRRIPPKQGRIELEDEADSDSKSVNTKRVKRRVKYIDDEDYDDEDDDNDDDDEDDEDEAMTQAQDPDDNQEEEGKDAEDGEDELNADADGNDADDDMTQVQGTQPNPDDDGHDDDEVNGSSKAADVETRQLNASQQFEEVVDYVQAMRGYGVEAKEAFELLYTLSGNVSAARYYGEHGEPPQGMRCWTEQEDTLIETCDNEEELVALENQDPDAFVQRTLWLEGSSAC